MKIIKKALWRTFGWKRIGADDPTLAWALKYKNKPNTTHILKGKHRYIKVKTGGLRYVETNGHPGKVFDSRYYFKDRKRRRK